MLALLFIVLVPLLYGGLYLWSNWDPYGRFSQIPVAVVNDDQPVTVNNQKVNAGQLFVDELKSDKIFDWHFVSDEQARQGLNNTDYYFAISVPRDFSAKLASGATGTPQRAGMLITLDDSNGYIVGKMAETAQSELQNKISAAAVSAYFESVFGNLQQLRDGITQAANGAGQLRDGLNQAAPAVRSLASGIGQLKTGADQLAPGAQQVSDGVNTDRGHRGACANQIAAAIPGVTSTASSAANTAAVAGDQRRPGHRRDLRWRQHDPGPADPTRPGQPDAAERSELPGPGEPGQPGGDRREPGQHQRRQRQDTTAQVAAAAKTLANDAPQLQAQVSGAASQVQQLADGAKQVASGASQLDTGLGTASTGATQLNSGITQLQTGANKLASGLTNAEGQLPVLSPDQQKNNANTLASPVDIKLTNLHPAAHLRRRPDPVLLLDRAVRLRHHRVPDPAAVLGPRHGQPGQQRAGRGVRLAAGRGLLHHRRPPVVPGGGLLARASIRSIHGRRSAC